MILPDMFGVNYSQSVRSETPKIAQDIQCIETIQLVIKMCIKSLQIGFKFRIVLGEAVCLLFTRIYRTLKLGKILQAEPRIKK